MYWTKNDFSEGVVNARRRFNSVPIGVRLTVCYTVSAFVMLAGVGAVLYWVLVRGLEADER